VRLLVRSSGQESAQSTHRSSLGMSKVLHNDLVIGPPEDPAAPRGIYDRLGAMKRILNLANGSSDVVMNLAHTTRSGVMGTAGLTQTTHLRATDATCGVDQTNLWPLGSPE
jgi:hypothetical protein